MWIDCWIMKRYTRCANKYLQLEGVNIIEINEGIIFYLYLFTLIDILNLNMQKLIMYNFNKKIYLVFYYK